MVGSEQIVIVLGVELEFMSENNNCEHEWKYVDDEYDSLANGGSYEIYRCIHCRKKSYSMLPD